MRGSLHFTTFLDEDAVRKKAAVLLAVNRRFVNHDDARFATILAHCERTVFDAEPILIKKCTPAALGLH
jgi:hypothetical protein